MKISFSGPMILLAGVLLGAASAVVAARALGTGEAAEDGIWRQRTIVSANSTSPYALASYVLDGRLPPAAGQLMEYSAYTDDEGNSLSPACNYTLTSSADRLPHWWSLAAEGSGDVTSLIAAPAVVGLPGGGTAIRVSASPQPGNWLRVPDGRSFNLIYTGAIDITVTGVAGEPPPFALSRSGC